MGRGKKASEKFSGTSYRSFLSKEEALKYFYSFMDKKATTSSFTPFAEETSDATSSKNASRSTKSVQAEKIAKLEDALLKKQIESLIISGDS